VERRNIIIAAAAVLIGLVAVYLANSWFSGVEERQERVAEEQRMVRIAVANQDMEFGSPLTQDNVRMTSWPASSVPQGAYLEADAQRLLSGGNVAIRPIARGEPILLSRISERAVLSANLPADMRAVTVPVDAVTGVAGFVTPGDVVDVLVTRQISGDGANSDDKMVSVVLERVPVLAIDLRAGEAQTEAALGKTATLQVSPRDAQKLVLATQVGRLSLALRNIEDQQGGAASGTRGVVTTRDLGGNIVFRGRPAAAPAPAPTVIAAAGLPSAVPAAVRRPSGPTMTVIRGTTVTEEEVQRHGY
jgi:pilus assembly protein CpaB